MLFSLMTLTCCSSVAREEEEEEEEEESHLISQSFID